MIKIGIKNLLRAKRPLPGYAREIELAIGTKFMKVRYFKYKLSCYIKIF